MAKETLRLTLSELAEVTPQEKRQARTPTLSPQVLEPLLPLLPLAVPSCLGTPSLAQH